MFGVFGPGPGRAQILTGRAQILRFPGRAGLSKVDADRARAGPGPKSENFGRAGPTKRCPKPISNLD